MSNLYGVIGDPIAHTLSPVIHHQIFKSLRLNNGYIPLLVKPPQLEAAVDILGQNFQGFNVTIPHKVAIMPYLDELHTSAEIYGAVNTIHVKEGRLVGYNTDGYGFTQGMTDLGCRIAGQKVLLVGAGGAARVAAFELVKAGANLTITNRSLSRAEDLAGVLRKRFRQAEIRVEHLSNLKSGPYYCIVNATPVGMYPHESSTPIGEDILKGVEFVYDLIYNPDQTRLLQMAERLGCKTINGLPMLVYQAVRAEEIWLERQLSREIVEDIMRFLKKGELPQ